jgi:hypothetical protein
MPQLGMRLDSDREITLWTTMRMMIQTTGSAKSDLNKIGFLVELGGSRSTVAEQIGSRRFWSLLHQLLKDRKRTTFLGLNYARGRC